MTIGGKLVAVPVRTATMALFYNEALLEERGIKAPPDDDGGAGRPGEAADVHAPQAGTPVVGMVVASDLGDIPGHRSRAPSAAISSRRIQARCPIRRRWRRRSRSLADLFKAGALPRSYATTSNDDRSRGCSRAAPRSRCCRSPATHSSIARTNRSIPDASRRSSFRSRRHRRARCRWRRASNSGRCAFPANARDKDLAWSFIQAMSSKAVTLGAARNGNGPVRISTFGDPSFAAAQPMAAIEAKALAKRAPRSTAGVSRGRARAGDLPGGGAARRARTQEPKEAIAAIDGAGQAAAAGLNGTEQVGRAS